jgi:hypothetical protein
MRAKLVEKTNHNAVHGLFHSRKSAERHLREVIPDYCDRKIFMDKTLTPESFEVIDCDWHKEGK